MKFIIVASIIFGLLIFQVNAEILITNVLYDPFNTDSGGEAIEIYNSGPDPQDISNWNLATETSAADATFPLGTVLLAGQYYLVADSGWNTSKDDPSWPSADHEEPLTLANSDSGVALVDSNGSIIDAVGWGVSGGIDIGLYEGFPTLQSAPGEALARVKQNGTYQDTNNNIDDFLSQIPSWSSSISPGSIIIEAIITGSAPVIENIDISPDDDSSTGLQIIPNPGSTKVININATITDPQGAADIVNVTLLYNSQTYQMNDSGNSFYSRILLINYDESPGIKNITIKAEDTSGLISELSTTIEILSLIAMQIDSSSLVFFGGPGDSYTIEGDKDTNTNDRVTIQNIGNSQLNVEVSGTDLTAGLESIPASALEYSFSSIDFSSIFAGTLSSTPKQIALGLAPAGKKEFSLRLNVPTSTQVQNYTGIIFLTAITP